MIELTHDKFLRSDCVAILFARPVSHRVMSRPDIYFFIDRLAASRFASVRSYSSLSEINIF